MDGSQLLAINVLEMELDSNELSVGNTKKTPLVQEIEVPPLAVSSTNVNEKSETLIQKISLHDSPSQLESQSLNEDIIVSATQDQSSLGVTTQVWLTDNTESQKDRRTSTVFNSDNESNDKILDHFLHSKTNQNQLETIKVKEKPGRMKRILLIDSDSDPEEIGNESSNESIIDENKDKKFDPRTKFKKFNRSFMDSDDSDMDEKENKDKKFYSGNEDTEIENSELYESNKSRLKTLIDSDSSDGESTKNLELQKTKTMVFDSEESNSVRDGIIKKSDGHKNMVDEAPVYIANDKGELIMENPVQNSFQKSRIAALCDSESDDDYPVESDYHDNSKSGQQSDEEASRVVKSKSEWEEKNRGRKNQVATKAERTFKMTPKDAVKQREEIAAESQRMVREKDVSLPYHKPKVHSLKEFLTRRSKLASVVPIVSRGNTSIATAVRMSNEQLEVFQKRLEEREKELKEFYKSESESENEDPEDAEYIPPGLKNNTDDNPKSPKNTEEFFNAPDNENEKINTENFNNLDGNGDINVEAVSNFTKLPEEKHTNNLSNDECDKVSSKISLEINQSENLAVDSDKVDLDSGETDLENNKETAGFVKDTDNDNMNENLRETGDFSLRIEESEIDNTKTNNESSSSDKSSTKILNDSEEVFNNSDGTSDPDNANVFKENTMSYDFSLDDIEENSDLSKSNNDMDVENVKEDIKDSLNNENNGVFEDKSKGKFEYGELDAEIENFGNEMGLSTKEKPRINILSDVTIHQNQIDNPNKQDIENAPPKSKLQLLKDKLVSATPKLSGAPDELIDLDEGREKSTAVTRLMERFAKHVSAKTKHSAKHKVSLSILTVENSGDIHQETVAINVDDEESAVSEIEEKPGAKLQKLRKELQSQMEKEKSERWQKKASEGIKSLSAESEDKEGYEDNLPDEYDDEEEEILTDEDEEAEDEELEEDDVIMDDKAARKNAFVDGEAEESETEDPENAAEDDEDTESHLENEDEENDKHATDSEIQDVDETSNVTAASESKDVSEDELPDLSVNAKNRPLKRIVKAFEDSDSDEENESELEKTLVEEQSNVTAENKENLEKTLDEDEEISAYQPRPNHTPVRQMTQPESGMAFNTPLSFITGLETLKSASKSLRGSPAPIVSPFQMPQDSALKTSFASQKKLFPESDADSQELNPIPETQPEPSQFTSNREEVTSLNLAETLLKQDTPCTQDILNICSGAFTGVTQLESLDKSAISKSLVLDSQTQEVKTLGEDQDLIISQLLDEEELENFKKKFESPINKPASSQFLTPSADEAKESSGGGVWDSDDEENGDEAKVKIKKRNRKIAFSDDDSSDEDQNDEEIDLQDDEGLEDEEELDNIGYDSEENEIELNDDGEPKKKEKIKIQDFMDAEAELSESEWGSEDEDENDLDKLEYEVGDTEKFDENQMKEDLEKIHMRRMLDDDVREVKLLQELLLEDGEMHGSGRQRQFRWKNIDDAGDEDHTERDEEDVYLDEEESEEQWRRRRHEREMFLKEKASQSQDDSQDDLLGTSKLLSIGQKILQRSLSLNSQTINSPTENPSEKIESPLLPKFTLLTKRGSFLSRGEQALQRVAEFTKTSTTINVNGSKTTKNFVFQTVSTAELALNKTKKRKAQDGTPDVLKKLRLTNTFSPASDVKKRKPEKAKRLF